MKFLAIDSIYATEIDLARMLVSDVVIQRISKRNKHKWFQKSNQDRHSQMIFARYAAAINLKTSEADRDPNV